MPFDSIGTLPYTLWTMPPLPRKKAKPARKSIAARSGLQALEDELRSLLAGGTYRPHQLFLSRPEIVARFRAPNFTVEKVLNRLSAAGLIYQKPRVGTFVAPRPITGKLLVVADQRGSHGADFGRLFSLPAFTEGLADALVERGLEWMILPVDPRSFRDQLGDLEYLYPQLTGVLFFGNPMAARHGGPSLDRKKIPHLFWGHEPPGEPLEGPALLKSKEARLRGALDHLLSRGKTRILILESGHPSESQECVTGWTEENRARKVLCETRGLGSYGDWSRNPEQVRLQLGDVPGKYDALLAMDMAAIHALNHLFHRKVRIPEEVAVMGLNNYPACLYSIRPLSAVGYDLRREAAHCLKLLLDPKAPRITRDDRFDLAVRETT